MAEGEALLDAGSVSHNHFFFARDAIDAVLAMRDGRRARGYAARLRAYTAAEPLPWSDLVSDRAEALCATSFSGTALERLAATARRLGQLDLVSELAGRMTRAELSPNSES